MSSYVLTDFEINLLVHLAVKGPREATHWRAMTDAPAVLGERLATSNYRMAGRSEDGPRDYSYSPLAVEVSAIEGLKQIEHYVYQTADSEGAWRRDGVGQLIDALRAGLTTLLPGWEEAPWRWTVEDVAAHESLAHDEAGDDPRVVDLRERFERAGAVLVTSNPATAVAGVFDPRSVLGKWHYPKKYRGMPPFTVVLLASDSIAASHFLHLRAGESGLNPHLHVGLFRFGSVVVRLSWQEWEEQPPGSPNEQDLWDLVERLGVPDERWTSLDPPVFEGSGEVVARRVRIVFTGHTDVTGLVAHDRSTLRRLAGMILDDDVRAMVEEVDPATRTVLLMRGLPEVGDVSKVAMRERVGVGTYDPAEPEYRVDLSVEPSEAGTASVIVMDRPPNVPVAVQFLTPESAPWGTVISSPPATPENG